MKKYFFTLFVLLFSFYYSQQVKYKILERESEIPLEFVKIEALNEIFFSNKDGEFSIDGNENDSIKISKSGYEIFKSKIGKLQEKIILNPKVYQIEEVVLESFPKILTNAYKSIENNYPLFPYQENFNLRIILKKNDTINKLEDIVGTVKRKSLFETKNLSIPKNQYAKVQLYNLRKVEKKEKIIYFKEFTFDELFLKIASIVLNPKEITFSTNKSESDDKIAKIVFSAKNSKSANGYYFINKKDNAILEYKILSDTSNSEFTIQKDYKYRTLNYELNTLFSKNEKESKYFISTVKMNATVEVIDPKENRTLFNISHYLTTNNSFNSLNFKENVSNTKDIFDVKGNFNSELFDTNKNFILNDELRNFIISAQSNPKEYNINR